jgi:glycosyltransferase involved in cell wall biosynthesis
VLFLIDSLGPGGAQRQLVTLVRSLDRSVVIPEVAYYHPIQHFRPELESADVALHELGPGGGKDPRVTARLARLMRAERFDIVHTFLRTPGVLARVAAALSPGARLVVSERNVGLGHSHRRLALERALAGRADTMIVNAEAIRREVLKLVPAWRGRVHVVPNGIEWTEPSDDDRADGERFREQHAGDAEVLLAALGRIEEQKAPDLLVEALEILPASSLDRLRVVWLGPRIDEELARRVEARVSGSSLAGRLAFLHETRETRRIYLAADAVVMPSRWEGMPNVVLESLAHGTPVVATDVGDAAVLVRPPEAGWLVGPDDPKALSEGIAAMLGASPEQRVLMGERGSRHVLEEFSSAKLAERTMAVYARVLGGHTAASDGADSEGTSREDVS